MEAKLTGQDAVNYLKSGRAIATFKQTESGNRYTYKIKASKKRPGMTWFVTVLTGSNNEDNYEYLGYITSDKYTFGTLKSRISQDAPSQKVFAYVWPRLVADNLDPRVEVWHNGHCGRCGRLLTDPESIQNGLGPICAGRTD